MNDSKPFWQSKTIIVGVLTTLATLFIPGAADWIKANPTEFTSLLTGLFVLLRIVTKGKVTLTATDA